MAIPREGNHKRSSVNLAHKKQTSLAHGFKTVNLMLKYLGKHCKQNQNPKNQKKVLKMPLIM